MPPGLEDNEQAVVRRPTTESAGVKDIAADLDERENFVKRHTAELRIPQSLPRDDVLNTPLLPDCSLVTPTEELAQTGQHEHLNIGGTVYPADQVIAKAPEGSHHLEHREHPKETDPTHMPTVSESKVVSVADKLYREPTRFHDKPNGPGKCNVYLDAVMRSTGLPRPWAETGVQSCEKLDQALAKDPRYDRMWQTDYSSDSAYQTAYGNWAYFKPQAGDIFIWATNQAVHTGIADGEGKLYYAGSRKNPSGTGHTAIENYTATAPDHETNYGPPTSVYRYKNLQR